MQPYNFFFGGLFIFFCSLAKVQHQPYRTLGLPIKIYKDFSGFSKSLMTFFFGVVMIFSIWEATVSLIATYHAIGQP